MLDLSVLAARRSLSVLGLLALVSVLPACSSMPSLSSSLPSVESLVTPYRIDIIQGNFVSREQAAALTPGMPRTQVRDVLGTPLLASIFHADRWDYVFTFSRSGQPPQKRKLTVFFKGDLLERVESDELPSEAEFVASIEPRKRIQKTPVLEASEQDLQAFAKDNAKAALASAPAPVPPISNYPPLEPSAPATAR
jgi:outer membrane protein assembly factor BamE